MGDATRVEESEFHNPTDEQLMPGKDSVVGFLAQGQTLEQVLRRDNEALAVLNYSRDEMIELLRVCDAREAPPAAFPSFQEWRNQGGNWRIDDLSRAYVKARDKFRKETRQESTYTAQNGKLYPLRVVSWRGDQSCPWGDINLPPNSNVDIFLRQPNGDEYHIPGMLKHLVQAHNFYEGGAYRCPPEELVELLGVEKTPGSIEQAKQIPLPGNQTA